MGTPAAKQSQNREIIYSKYIFFRFFSMLIFLPPLSSRKKKKQWRLKSSLCNKYCSSIPFSEKHQCCEIKTASFRWYHPVNSKRFAYFRYLTKQTRLKSFLWQLKIIADATRPKIKTTLKFELKIASPGWLIQTTVKPISIRVSAPCFLVNLSKYL